MDQANINVLQYMALAAASYIAILAVTLLCEARKGRAEFAEFLRRDLSFVMVAVSVAALLFPITLPIALIVLAMSAIDRTGRRIADYIDGGAK